MHSPAGDLVLTSGFQRITRRFAVNYRHRLRARIYSPIRAVVFGPRIRDNRHAADRGVV